MAGLAWGVSGAFGPVVPLIIFALNYKRSKFIAFHALQAALSYLAMVVVAMISGLVLGGSAGVLFLQDGMPQAGDAMPPLIKAAMLAIAGLTGAVYLGLIVLSIKFSKRASAGEWACYPFVNRLAASLYDVSDITVTRRVRVQPEG